MQFFFCVARMRRKACRKYSNDRQKFENEHAVLHAAVPTFEFRVFFLRLHCRRP
jgi:hypothetical protein